MRHTPSRVVWYLAAHSADPFPFGLVHPGPNTPATAVRLIAFEHDALSTYLLEKEFIVRPVVPPNLSLGEDRVRVCLRAVSRKCHCEAGEGY